MKKHFDPKELIIDFLILFFIILTVAFVIAGGLTILWILLSHEMTRIALMAIFVLAIIMTIAAHLNSNDSGKSDEQR